MVGSNLHDWPTICLCLLYSALVSSAICNSDAYGSPSIDDCNQAISKIPFAQAAPRNIKGQRPRNFAEPQFMQPTFGGISNDHRPDAIVQLPKIWKHNSCRIALMSEARPMAIKVLDPQFVASWHIVKEQFSHFRNCFAGGIAKGGYAPLTLRGRSHVAALYMYTSDSPFNLAQMSSYMSIGFPVEPVKQPSGIGSLSNSSQISQLGTLGNRSELETEFKRQVLSSKPLGTGRVTLEDKLGYGAW